jgi:hypothetical protein
MQLLINDTTVNLPTSPDEVTLGQRMAFYTQHGRTLDEMLNSILQLEEEAQEVEFMAWQAERMYCVFSFFSGIDVEVLRACDYQDELVTLYFSFLQGVFDEAAAKPPFLFSGDEWQLPSPEVKQGSAMTFGEFIDAKQVIQDIAASGGGKVDILHPLTAIFLKKKESGTVMLFYSREANALN